MLSNSSFTYLRDRMKRLQERESLQEISQEVSEKSQKLVKPRITVGKRQAIIILLAVALLIILALIYFVLFSGNLLQNSNRDKVNVTYTPSPGITVGPSPDATQTVEVLPEDSRVIPEKDPFGTIAGDLMASIRLSGVLSGEHGRDTAIFTDGKTSYIVGIEEYIGDSEWYLVEIIDNTAILTDDEETMTVGFEGRE
jgi:multidrug efflux pump subunit AcrB